MFLEIVANSSSTGQSFAVYLKTFVNTITITPDGSDTIEGDATLVLDTVGQHVRLFAVGDGTWLIM